MSDTSAPEIRPATDEEIAVLTHDRVLCEVDPDCECCYGVEESEGIVVFGSHENCRCDIPAIRQRKRLIARIRQLEAEVEDWRNREASACPEDFGFEEVIAALRAAAQERDRQIAVLKQEKADYNETATRRIEEIERLRAALGTLEERLFGLGEQTPICQLHRAGLSAMVDFIRAALKPESTVR